MSTKPTVYLLARNCLYLSTSGRWVKTTRHARRFTSNTEMDSMNAAHGGRFYPVAVRTTRRVAAL